MRIRRLMGVSLATVSALVAGSFVPAQAASTAVSTATAVPAGKPKIERQVLETFAKTDKADFWVRMADDTDVSSAATIKGRTARGVKVMDELTAAAERSQAPVKRLLKAADVKSTAFWVTDAIYVEDAPEALARKIAALPGVAELRAPRTYAAPKPVSVKPASAIAAGTEWGVANINADDVWAQTGRHGEDIVVANIDTGVQYDHPALVGQYRGNNGDGTFTHDYNWMNAPSAPCKDPGPCDNAGHGTHTMGTMAGDDGAGNQVGVAPGVKWIAAKGCATDNCAETDLLAASQWILAPTDSNGENPDASKRPHVVNNSWGSGPGSDPMFEDVQQAWAASGIMGIWSNGNDGERGCRTAGSPGSRTINYSVGAYDINDKIAVFSSRGPGQDGLVKPNISAPGVNVRSSVPGNAYGLMSGTSMAAPHTAGAVALLWSARPELARDIDVTRELLNISAVDTPDAQCGGTAENNNVYGEGRLDALGLVNAGTAGTGTLSGAVTDAGSGAPIPGATVSLTGPMNRTFTVGADGAYRFSLIAGDYTVSVSAFGYAAGGRTVTLAKDGAVTVDLPLTPTERVNLTGAVTDGSGQGWGLAAKVVAADGAGHSWSTETDPETGAYTLPLLPSLAYTVTVSATVTGYEQASRQVTLGATGQVLDVGLIVRPACDARGYEVIRDGSTQPFDGTRAPKGWTVTNVDPHIPGYAYRPGWEFGDPGARGNTTGGEGGFAVVDSLNSGAGHVQDTYLTSPSYDLTGRTKATIEFAQDLQPAVNSTTSVDVSVDGGTSWRTAWTAKGFPGAPGPATQVIAIPQATDRTAVKFRLHYTGQRSGWWSVDNAFIGDRTCVPTS